MQADGSLNSNEIIKNIEEAAKFLKIEEVEQLKKVTEIYPFSATRYYLEIASSSNAVRKMVIPSSEEINPEIQKYGSDDPLCEERDKKAPRLTHRYPDRVLIVTTNTCPVLCRFCMRKRNWLKQPFTISDGEIESALDYIAENREIRDVLISGGEPLLLPVRKLRKMLTGLKKVEHVEIVRIGTRLPTVAPNLLKKEVLETLEEAEKVWINTHFNHPDEITDAAAKCIRKILKSGTPINNQTVLLKGVNDSVETLEKLFRRLQKIKVRPYYLFHCDPVKGVIHFSTSITKGLQIVRELFRRLSPLAIPYYAVDGPGGFGKVPLFPQRFQKVGNTYQFEAYDGRTFTMEDR